MTSRARRTTEPRQLPPLDQFFRPRSYFRTRWTIGPGGLIGESPSPRSATHIQPCHPLPASDWGYDTKLSNHCHSLAARRQSAASLCEDGRGRGETPADSRAGGFGLLVWSAVEGARNGLGRDL